MKVVVFGKKIGLNNGSVEDIVLGFRGLLTCFIVVGYLVWEWYLVIFYLLYVY